MDTPFAYSVDEACTIACCGRTAFYEALKSGELRAVNVATRTTGRPRYLVDEADLAVFEQRRSSVCTVTKKVPRPRRTSTGVIDFF